MPDCLISSDQVLSFVDCKSARLFLQKHFLTWLSSLVLLPEPSGALHLVHCNVANYRELQLTLIAGMRPWPVGAIL